MGLVLRGLAVVDARGVDADGIDLPVLQQPARRLRIDARKVQLGDRPGPTLRGAEVPCGVRPARRVTRANQQNRIVRNPAVRLLEPLEVGHGHEVIGVLPGRLGDVDDDGRTDETLERNLVDGVAALREMHGRVDMRSAMLGRPEIIGRVVEPRGRHAVVHDLELEALGRRPEDGVFAVRVRQINDDSRWKPGGGSSRGWRGRGARGRGEQGDDGKGPGGHAPF